MLGCVLDLNLNSRLYQVLDSRIIQTYESDNKQESKISRK